MEGFDHCWLQPVPHCPGSFSPGMWSTKGEKGEGEAWGDLIETASSEKMWRRLIAGYQHNIMPLISFLKRKQPWWLCGEQKPLHQGALSRDGEAGAVHRQMCDVEISIICTSVCDAPVTLWKKIVLTVIYHKRSRCNTYGFNSCCQITQAERKSKEKKSDFCTPWADF